MRLRRPERVWGDRRANRPSHGSSSISHPLASPTITTTTRPSADTLTSTRRLKRHFREQSAFYQTSRSYPEIEPNWRSLDELRPRFRLPKRIGPDAGGVDSGRNGLLEAQTVGVTREKGRRRLVMAPSEATTVGPWQWRSANSSASAIPSGHASGRGVGCDRSYRPRAPS
jgi:hypothetical protein